MSSKISSDKFSSDMPRFDRSHEFWQTIRTVPDFPKKGIDFYDIMPLLRTNVRGVTDALIEVLPKDLLQSVDCFVGVEARGFVFASLLADRLDKGLILLRKPGKLPPPVTNQSYSLEYGCDALEIQQGVPPSNLLLVDDILATGGTLRTARDLCQSADHSVLGVLVLLDLVDLHDAFSLPVYSVLQA